MKEIIILASGNGSNFESICVYFSKSKFIRVKQLITDNKDAFVIQRAKKYAQEHNISLSKLIETYFDSLTKSTDNSINSSITPLVDSLSGLLELPADFDYKKEYREHIADKYK